MIEECHLVSDITGVEAGTRDAVLADLGIEPSNKLSSLTGMFIAPLSPQKVSASVHK